MHAAAQNRALQFLTVSIVLCLGCLFAVAFCSNILFSSRIAQNCPLQFLTMFYSSLSKCLLAISLCSIFCTVPGLHKTVLCGSWPYLVLFTLSARYIVLQYISLQSLGCIQTHAVAQNCALQFLTLFTSVYVVWLLYRFAVYILTVRGSYSDACSCTKPCFAIPDRV